MKKTGLIYGFGIVFLVSAVLGAGVNLYTLMSGGFVFDPVWEPYLLLVWHLACGAASLLIILGDRSKGALGANCLAGLVLVMLIFGKIMDLNVRATLIQLAAFGLFGISKQVREYFKL